MDRSKNFDICIIGGGASGMAAVVSALQERPDANVILLEKNDVLGRKLRATGSGRCNITNTEAPGYLRSMEFFRELGLVTRTYPNGLVYPYSESANDVAELLSDRVKELGCSIVTGAAVSSVMPLRKSSSHENAGFEILYDKKDRDGITMEHKVRASSVILAVGGKSGPNFGTTGDGYKLARELGHSIVRPVPVLTQVICNNDGCDKLSGIRAKGRVSLYHDETGAFAQNTKIFVEEGEIQFTYYGLSGIAIFNMTRMMRLGEGGSFGDFAIDIDLFPEGDIREILTDHRNKAAAVGSKMKCAVLLRTILKGELAEYVLKRAGIASGRLISDLTDDELSALSENVHALRFSPTGLKGWKEAQCTSGGVALGEVDKTTCGSLIVPGVFITGELLDYDGPCGGYNLTNAWITGIDAGIAAAKATR